MYNITKIVRYITTFAGQLCGMDMQYIGLLRDRRMRRVLCFVISIGSFTVDGTGQTSCIAYLVRLLQVKLGAVLSSGYKWTTYRRGLPLLICLWQAFIGRFYCLQLTITYCQACVSLANRMYIPGELILTLIAQVSSLHRSLNGVLESSR